MASWKKLDGRREFCGKMGLLRERDALDFGLGFAAYALLTNLDRLAQAISSSLRAMIIICSTKGGG